MEAWRMILITSQALHPTKCEKMITEKVHGVIVMNLRVDEIHGRRIWGAKYVPVLSGKCLLAKRLLQRAHSSLNWNLRRAHRTVEGTKAALQTGKLGICIPGATTLIRVITLNCPTCNSNRKWTYSAGLATNTQD